MDRILLAQNRLGSVIGHDGAAMTDSRIFQQFTGQRNLLEFKRKRGALYRLGFDEDALDSIMKVFLVSNFVDYASF